MVKWRKKSENGKCFFGLWGNPVKKINVIWQLETPCQYQQDGLVTCTCVQMWTMRCDLFFTAQKLSAAAIHRQIWMCAHGSCLDIHVNDKSFLSVMTQCFKSSYYVDIFTVLPRRPNKHFLFFFRYFASLSLHFGRHGRLLLRLSWCCRWKTENIFPILKQIKKFVIISCFIEPSITSRWLLIFFFLFGPHNL